MSQSTVSLGSHNRLARHMRKIGTNHEVHGDPEPKHERPGNKAATNPKEASHNADQKANPS
jgi:hypothetical protein